MDTKISIRTPAGTLALTPSALSMLIAYAAYLASEGYTGRAAGIAYDAYDAAMAMARPDLAILAARAL